MIVLRRSIPWHIEDTYKKWIKANEPGPKALQQQKHLSLNFKNRPKISILAVVISSNMEHLKRTIQSVIDQTYNNWELCLVINKKAKEDIKAIISRYAMQDIRVKIISMSEEYNLADYLNKALSMVSGEYISLLDCKDVLAPFALYECVKALNDKTEMAFVYSDEDSITDFEKRINPYFKPDWAPDLFLSWMYTGRFGLYRKSIVDEVGGFRSGFDGAEEYDLALRIIEKHVIIGHITKVLYHFKLVTELKESKAVLSSKAYQSGKRALTDYLKRNGRGTRWYMVRIIQGKKRNQRESSGKHHNAFERQA
jgi:glycosyltransferase involved in cell wall biosynthesis